MSAARAERIRRWHEAAYASSRAAGAQDADYLGLALHVPADVQPITGMSHLLGEAVLGEVRDGDRVLDMGTGCGVNAILAARRSRAVVGVDVNPSAVAAARANAERNGVGDRVEIRHGDLFAAAPGAFDLIVFDPPFRWFAPRTPLEAATTDEGYATLTRFFAEAGAHLAPGGRILVFFGSSGDLDYLDELIAGAGLAGETVAEDELERDGWTVRYLTRRLTYPASASTGGIT